ncbi:MAG: GNAT family N-acetyltransferase, partial [Acetobacteraceae bacterium]
MRSARPLIRVEVFPTVDAVPREAELLFGPGDALHRGQSWWRTVIDHAMPADLRPRFVLIRAGDDPVALFPMQAETPGRGFGALTTPYTCAYAPLLAPGLTEPLLLDGRKANRGAPGDGAAAGCEIESTPATPHTLFRSTFPATDIGAAVFAAFGRFCRRFPLTRLDALPAEWPFLDGMAAGAAAAGLVALRFEHFGNWHEPVAGLDWAEYLAARPGALRETVRRRLRRSERLPAARFGLFTTPEQIGPAAEAFESVYARSWKEPEPFPRFNTALMHACSRLGTLRLGVWFLDEVPIAAQFWVVEDGIATVLKLAHDDAFRSHSPGTVLTALMLRHLLDREGVREIDFGRGDDAYKAGWAKCRRPRMGLLLATPWRAGGLAAILRHGAGRVR